MGKSWSFIVVDKCWSFVVGESPDAEEGCNAKAECDSKFACGGGGGLGMVLVEEGFCMVFCIDKD